MLTACSLAMCGLHLQTGIDLLELNCLWLGAYCLAGENLFSMLYFERVGGVAQWYRVERLSLAGELSLSCARPAADG